MKKALTITLTDEELLELYRILLDKDAEGALNFLETRLKSQIHTLLEGG